MVIFWQKFGQDLAQLFKDIDSLDPTVLLVEGANGQAISGSVELDEGKMQKLLLQVSFPYPIPVLPV